MRLRTLQALTIAALAAGIAFCASDAWKKDPAQWTEQDIDKILTDSPWAKEVKPEVAMQRGRGGGMGRGRMGRGGIGFPGGVGFPGGGYPGGGGGYPGGGGGYPGGGRRGGGDTGQQTPPQPIIVRWESARPVELALKRRDQAAPQSGTLAAAAAPTAVTRSEIARPAGAADSDYVVTVVGLNLPERSYRASGDDSGSSGDNQNAPDPQEIKDRLMSRVRLLRKNMPALTPVDVKVKQTVGLSQIQFLFPKTEPISLNDKDVTFELQVGRAKYQQKFHLKDMKYQGRLAL
jgi:hypothetical protein